MFKGSRASMRHEEWNEVQLFREPTQELVNVRRVLSQTRQEHPGILAVCLGRRFRSIVALKSGNNGTAEHVQRFGRGETV